MKQAACQLALGLLLFSVSQFDWRLGLRRPSVPRQCRQPMSLPKATIASIIPELEAQMGYSVPLPGDELMTVAEFYRAVSLYRVAGIGQLTNELAFVAMQAELFRQEHYPHLSPLAYAHRNQTTGAICIKLPVPIADRLRELIDHPAPQAIASLFEAAPGQ